MIQHLNRHGEHDNTTQPWVFLQPDVSVLLKVLQPQGVTYVTRGFSVDSKLKWSYCPNFRELNLTFEDIKPKTLPWLSASLTACSSRASVAFSWAKKRLCTSRRETKPFTAASWLVFVVNEAWRVLGIRKVDHSLTLAFAVRNGHIAASSQGRIFLQI